MVQTAKQPQQGSDDIIPQAQAKVSRSLVDEVAGLSGLSKGEIASLIGLTERAVFKTTKGNFSILISEHLLLLKSLFEHGLAVFDQNKKAFNKWLKTPLPELASPLTGFFPEWPNSQSLPLEQMGSNKPVDLMAYSIQRDQEAQSKPVQDQRPYPTPFSLLNTSTGIRLVDDVFGRIEGGVYS